MTVQKKKELSKLEKALNYAKEGWAVLPLHTVVNGMCTCSKKAQCSGPGKHPRTKHGVKDATKDPEQIRAWWTQWPDSNIGLAMGERSGRVALDVDIKNDKRGDQTLAELQKEFAPLPKTPKSRTGSGGYHYIFKAPKKVGQPFINFREGLDFMANGSYIVAPPSTVTKGAYKWLKKGDEAECPDWLLKLANNKGKKLKHPKTQPDVDFSAVIKELLPSGEEQEGEWRTICPFHGEQPNENPPFCVNLVEGMYHCFACNENGTVIQLFAKVKGIPEEKARTFLGIPPKGGMTIPIIEHNGVLAKISQTKEGPQYKPITSFSMEPIKAIHVTGQGEYLKVLLKAQDKQFPVDIPPEAWLNTNSFLKCLPAKETTFWGSNQDVQFIRAYLGTFPIPTVHGTATAGFHKTIFVTEEGAIGPKGAVSDLEYVNPSPSGCHLITQNVADRSEIKQFKKYLPTFNSPKIVATILGWTVACFFKSRLAKLVKQFPLLCLEGEPGAGKTATATNVIMKLWALDPEPKAISEQTKFTFMKLVSGSNAPPLVFEENKNWRMDQKQQNLISSLIRHTYNGFQGTRGLANQRLNHFHYQAPVVIVGESGFAEPAVLDRMVFAHFSKQESRPYEQGFQQLCSLRLEGLGRRLLNHALTMEDDQVRELFEQEFRQVDPQLTDRPRHNAAIVRLGLRVLGEALEMAFELPTVDAALKEQIFDNGHERKSAVDNILETMGLMSQITPKGSNGKPYLFSEFLEEGIHYEVTDGSLRVHLAGAYPSFKRYASTYTFDGDILDENSFKKQLKKEPYFEASKPAQIGQTTRNAWILNLQKMEEKGLNLPEEWLSTTGTEPGVTESEDPF